MEAIHPKRRNKRELQIDDPPFHSFASVHTTISIHTDPTKKKYTLYFLRHRKRYSSVLPMMEEPFHSSSTQVSPSFPSLEDSQVELVMMKKVVVVVVV